jgi:hypothetical protein
MAETDKERYAYMNAMSQLVQSFGTSVATIAAAGVPDAACHVDDALLSRTAGEMAACLVSLRAVHELVKNETQRRREEPTGAVTGAAADYEEARRMIAEGAGQDSSSSREAAAAAAAPAAAVATNALAQKVKCCCGKTFKKKSMMVRHHNGIRHECLNKPTCTFKVRAYNRKDPRAANASTSSTDDSDRSDE